MCVCVCVYMYINELKDLNGHVLSAYFCHGWTSIFLI